MTDSIQRRMLQSTEFCTLDPQRYSSFCRTEVKRRETVVEWPVARLA